MSRFANAPLQKITINIYKTDYNYLVDHYGHGWSELVREFLKQRLDIERKGS